MIHFSYPLSRNQTERLMKRPPRNYDGPLSTSKQLRELLPEVLNQISLKVKDRPDQILEAWKEIVGGRIANMTRAVSYDAGVLKVLVKNSTLYSLLVEHEKKRLVSAFKEKFPNVSFREISFKIG